MSLSELGGMLIVDQVEVIREIARNLLGEAPPAGPRLVSGPMDVSWTRFTPGDPADAPETAVVRGGEQPAGALSLLGLRRPYGAPAGPGAPGVSELAQIVRLLSGDGAGTGLPAGGALPGASAPGGRQADGSATAFGTAGTAGAAFVLDDMSAAASGDGATDRAVDRAGTAVSGEILPPAAAKARADARHRAEARAERDRRAATSEAAAAAGTAARPEPAAEARGRGLDGVSAAASADRAWAAMAEQALQGRTAADAVAMLGLTGGAARLDGLGAERAGTLASFILNAHMLPGWPPPRPFAGVGESLKTLHRTTPQLSVNEEQLLVYLLNLGLNLAHLARVLKTIRSARRRSGILAAIASLLSSATGVLHVVELELGSLVEDLMQERRLRMRLLPSARVRTDLG